MAAPTVTAAHRAAQEIVDAGAGTVLMFGSLARGEASAVSDIDLVAIFDDLADYGDRSERRSDLEARARSAAGCSVDVLVTDAPEWAVRTTRVPCSLEARIARDAVCLADSGEHGPIDWGKEIGLPATPTAELEQRFGNFSAAVSTLTQRLRPSQEEIEAADAGDTSELADQEDLRFAQGCAAAHMIFEAAAKIAQIVTTGTAPEREHRIPALLADQPDWVAEAFRSAAVGISLYRLHEWHQGANYADARPVERFDEAYLRRHAAAAIRVAEFVGDQCRDRGLDADLLRRFDLRLGRCAASLAGVLRISA